MQYLFRRFKTRESSKTKLFFFLFIFLTVHYASLFIQKQNEHRTKIKNILKIGEEIYGGWKIQFPNLHFPHQKIIITKKKKLSY